MFDKIRKILPDVFKVKTLKKLSCTPKVGHENPTLGVFLYEV